MKKCLLHFCCVALLASSLVLAPSAPAAAAPKSWRIAVIVGGPSINYQRALQGLAERLAELGIISNGTVPLPEHDESLAPMWQWLAENARGDTLRFVADAFYSPEWNPEKRAQVRHDLVARLRNKGDIDCVLAFGTWSGQDIVLETLNIPLLILSTTNAVEAGIIPSPDDSGRDNLLAIVQPDRYKREVQTFYELIGFSKLGIVYEDTPTGRSSIALKEIEAAVRDTRVELLRCIDFFDIEDSELAAQRLRICHENLVQQGVDAVYLTFNQTYNRRLPGDKNNVLEPLMKAGIPTFAQPGADLVKRGALLSSAKNSYREEGIFAAEALEKFLYGSLPRSLSQRYESTVSLAVNLRTAARIGWNLPMEILAAVDEFYRDF